MRSRISKKRPGRLLSTLEIQALDKFAIETLGMSSLSLMENAGRAVSSKILHRLNKRKKSQKPFVVIFCGLGNNAGDGFVVARHLHLAGVGVKTYIIGKVKNLKSDAAANYQILKWLKSGIRHVEAMNRFVKNDIAHCDVVVDAIFGVGLNRDVEEPFFSVIQAINKYGKYVVSVDVPSGLDSTSGRIQGNCVKANVTVTFSFAKKGFFKNDGPHYTGRVVVADIGIPKALIKKIKTHG